VFVSENVVSPNSGSSKLGAWAAALEALLAE